MNRRGFLKKSGASIAIGGGILKANCMLSSDVRTASVKIHQSQAVTDHLHENNKDKSKWSDWLVDNLPPVFNTDIPQLEMNTSIGRLDIPTETQLDSADNLALRVKHLYSWMFYAETSNDVNPVNESNILLRPMPEDDIFDEAAGYGMIDIIPSCLSFYNNYAVVWIDREYIDSKTLLHGVAHEVGHNLGLKHSHGTNIRDNNSVMLTQPYALNNDKNQFGENIENCLHRINKLNPKITKNHLSL